MSSHLDVMFHALIVFQLLNIKDSGICCNLSSHPMSPSILHQKDARQFLLGTLSSLIHPLPNNLARLREALKLASQWMQCKTTVLIVQK
mmetsp:Transcript_18816/g.39630  ORF Transcript_18816/g.39630 Transcript_18816/m.39630 type:complete len:89 (+) Transcript_18816:270-536(+)